MRFAANSSLVVTGSWDRTIACWDTRSPTPAGGFNLDERVYAMDLKGDACVAITATNQIHVFDMRAGSQVNQIQRPLQYQLRDRTSVVQGKRVSVRVALGARRIIKK